MGEGKEGGGVSEWRTINSAPKDGTRIRACRMIEGAPMFVGDAVWRTITFLEAFISGMLVPEETVTGWMLASEDKRYPEPTHWMPASTQVEAG